MANEEQLALLGQGVDAWNEWRTKNPELKPDLSGADLSGVQFNEAFFRTDDSVRVAFRGIDLPGVNLRGVNLSAADLTNADLTEADLTRANLTGAYFSGANLRGAVLHGAVLRFTNLGGANLTGAVLYAANLTEANLTEANLTEADLREAQLIDTNLKRAILTGCRVYGVSAWKLNLEDAQQFNLIITTLDEPVITVDDLEVAQFIYLLLNHKKLRNVVNSVTERGVLTLGRFGGGGLEVLQAIATKLREEHYLPIIFDFERPMDRNYTETVKTLVGLARFVIVDLSGPSVPQELSMTVPFFKIPFVPILEEVRKPYTMAVDIFEYPWVVRPPVSFTSIDDLMEKIPGSIIAPAEELKERQALLDQLFRS